MISPDKIQSKLRDNDPGLHSVPLHTFFPVRDMIRKLTDDDFDPNGFKTYPDDDFDPNGFEYTLIMISVQNRIRSETYSNLNHLMIPVEN